MASTSTVQVQVFFQYVSLYRNHPMYKFPDSVFPRTCGLSYGTVRGSSPHRRPIEIPLWIKEFQGVPLLRVVACSQDDPAVALWKPIVSSAVRVVVSPISLHQPRNSAGSHNQMINHFTWNPCIAAKNEQGRLFPGIIFDPLCKAEVNFRMFKRSQPLPFLPPIVPRIPLIDVIKT